MGQRRHKIVLFLCTGNHYRSRFAECLFNSVAERMGLPWIAISRGLAVERGVKNIGAMSRSAIKALETLGVRPAEAMSRFPMQATVADLEHADWIVALKQAEHSPLLQERFPAFAEKVEYWHVEDAPQVLGLIEREVMDLIARLMSGGIPRAGGAPELPSEEVCPRCGQLVVRCTCQTVKDVARSNTVVRVGRETKGRRGKGVTTVTDLPLDEAELLELAARLKQKCGSGGTVKDGRIEIQGDLRERLVAELERMGYRVKRTGG
jgi:protein-tyrosine phosphatase